jgi:peptidoglycan/LPS O-acetylase OafA/YrhL
VWLLTDYVWNSMAPGQRVEGMTNFSAKSLFGPGMFRLFLATVVMVHHSFPFRAGAWAVDVFFILSGYWITRMWDSRYSRTRASYFTFLVSRWWRLLPVFFVCTALGLSSAMLLQGPGAFIMCADPTWWLRQVLIAGSSDAGRILPLTWSLDVEMQFYIVAPAIIYVFSKIGDRARWLVIAGLLAMLSAFFLRGAAPDSARFGLFSGFFLAGVSIALSGWVARWPTIFAGLALFIGGIVLLLLFPPTRNGLWFEGKLAASPATWVSSWWIFAAVLILPLVSRNIRIRSSGFDRFLGNLAYPLYLFHWIPRQWYYQLCETNSSSLVRVLLLTANFIVAFGGASLILLFIDQPLDRLRANWVGSRQIRSEAEEGEIVSSGESAKKQVHKLL